MSALEHLPIPSGPAALAVLPRLRAALDGGAPVLPYGQDTRPPLGHREVGRAEMRSGRGESAKWAGADAAHDLPLDTAVVIGTSGSTGAAKQAILGAGALRASADATHAALSGPGHWLLALPAHHIAGLQVLLRSIVAGTDPTVVDTSSGFTAAAFSRAVADMPSGEGPRYVSLVPTQLARVLGHEGAREALLTFDAVLVGGAATAPSLAARARRAGVHLELTYGMSETCGGCVYNGVPLDGVEVHIDNDRHIVLGGAVLAEGYLTPHGVQSPDHPGSPFTVDADGVRWFRTDDLGSLDDEVRLKVHGRADDLIITGGLKVTPGMVEDAIVRHVPGVDEALVVGLDDSEWGQVVAAGLRMVDPAQRYTCDDLRDILRGTVPDPALPRRAMTLTTIPLRGPGKPDRAALREAFEDRSARA